MANLLNAESLLFSESTKAEFHQYIAQTPNNRRVSQQDKETILAWLTEPFKRPTSQQEYSRRNYVQKTFSWNTSSQTIFALPKNKDGPKREMVTVEEIVATVERVHDANNHAGWDATWRDVSNSYYGILRADVIFLLKRCPVCNCIPSKRPKGQSASRNDSEQTR